MPIRTVSLSLLLLLLLAGCASTPVNAQMDALWQVHAQRAPTTQTSLGSFYKLGAPPSTNLWRDGDQGQRLALIGRVLDREGEELADALVEVWHADASGSVDESR